MSIADIARLHWWESMLREKFELATDFVGHDEESQKQIKVLNRFISVKDSGFSYEPDVRHPEMIVNELGLQGAKTLSTPMSDMHHESGEMLGHEMFKKHSVVMRICELLGHIQNWLAIRSQECCEQCETGPN